MPLFYLQPFNFHKKKPAGPYEITGQDVLIFILTGIIGLGLLIGLIAYPAWLVFNSAPK